MEGLEYQELVRHWAIDHHKHDDEPQQAIPFHWTNPNQSRRLAVGLQVLMKHDHVRFFCKGETLRHSAGVNKHCMRLALSMDMRIARLAWCM